MRREIERRTQKLAEDLLTVCDIVRRRANGSTPANQLLDASSSSAANYRAAGRARSKREFTAKLGVANEEADETVFWLEFIGNSGLDHDLDLAALQQEAKELRAIIAASYATARRNSGHNKDDKRSR